MVVKYNPQKIEKKWQSLWNKKGFYQAKDSSKNPKYYFLIEFPYPSGDGLHVGHCRSFSAFDVLARKKRMQGFNVLYPMGWDAFGLPAENYAIKTGIHPSITTKKNITTFKRQMQSLGLSFDWKREIDTTDPKYYKWTQWIFLKLFENGLAYKKKMTINWCPKDKIGLANEEVIDGKCERCGTPVEQKEKEQWLLRITKYADRLIEDLDKVDYLEKIKTQQINWIGKSFGVEVDFKVEKSNKKITVFTTRVDTIFGVTAVVLSPDNPLVKEVVIENKEAGVNKYIEESKRKSELERAKSEKEKTGVFTGSYCINPLNNEKVQIWVGDYVVASYGGGAVMMVPAHDKRDLEFAKQYNLPIKIVIQPMVVGETLINPKISSTEIVDRKQKAFDSYEEAYVGTDGKLINSGEFTGLYCKDAIEKITQWLESKKLGKGTIQYKLRDWIFSRQHYWGEPIPIIHCSECGTVPVPEKDLPVKLPFAKKYQPTGTGESPLASISSFVNVKCPICKGLAKRETDTMPNWAGSSWYFIRYIDPKNSKAIAGFKKMKYWLPVDWYNGGMEHTTLHLLYSRFWHKFLYDIKVVPQSEPYQKRTSHGMVLAEDGRKMSKSWGNVINPDDVLKQYGADTLRLYEMFMGPFGESIAWDTKGIVGVRRFLDRFWNQVISCSSKKSGKDIIASFNRLIKKVTEDLDDAKFNTVVAAFMEFLNLVGSNQDKVGKDVIEKLVILFAPLAPHITEELWVLLGNKTSVHLEKWPKYSKDLIKEENITIIMQVNGRVRGKLEVKSSVSEEEIKNLALSNERIKQWLHGNNPKKVIYVPGKLINIVV